MKNNICLLFAVFITFIKVQGQDRITVGIIETKSVTFDSKKVGNSFMEVNNQKSFSIINTPPRNLIKLQELKYNNIDNLWTAFTKVFGKQRLQDLLPEKNMIITLYPDHLGRVKAVQFLVKNNTIITPTELESLEKNIINDVSFIIPRGMSDNIWPLTQNVVFGRIYQRLYSN